VTLKHIAWICMLVMLTLMALSLAGHTRAQDKGAGFNDDVIGEMVKSAFNNDSALRTMDISIDVRNRVVHLRGFVNSMSDMARAEVVARGVQGVAAVKNAIRVANRPSRA
jgi:osmotically-inducible protein OsmY